MKSCKWRTICIYNHYTLNKIWSPLLLASVKIGVWWLRIIPIPKEMSTNHIYNIYAVFLQGRDIPFLHLTLITIMWHRLSWNRMLAQVWISIFLFDNLNSKMKAGCKSGWKERGDLRLTRENRGIWWCKGSSQCSNLILSKTSTFSLIQFSSSIPC